MPLTARQEEILARVVETHVSTGSPVGSKTLVEKEGVGASPSTVRYELSVLEEQGLLTHPHTSAGRVPTDLGYRYYVDRLLERLGPRRADLHLELSEATREVDTALRATTDALAQVTHLLALVSAPPLETTIVRHVEVLRLQPQLVMVVVITSTGGVTKRVFAFSEPVDPGLADWAHECDVLLAECSLPADMAMEMHLTPEQCGALAERASPRLLVLTHFYPPVERVNIRAAVAQRYTGPLVLATDGWSTEIEEP